MAFSNSKLKNALGMVSVKCQFLSSCPRVKNVEKLKTFLDIALKFLYSSNPWQSMKMSPITSTC